MKQKKRLIICVVFIFSMVVSSNINGLPITSTFTPQPGPNNAPLQTNHLLWDGNQEHALNASDVAVNSVSINFTINDLDGDNMDWYIYQGTNLVDSDTTTGNGTKITTNVSWFTQLQNYTLYFNVTDGSSWNNKTLWFTTTYTIPVFSDENPPNGSTITTDSRDWSITITDTYPFNYTIEASNNQSTNGTRNTTGTYTLSMTNLSEYTEYIVWVNATNGNNSISEWFVFNTLGFGSTNPRRPGGGGGGVIPTVSADDNNNDETGETETMDNQTLGIIILLAVGAAIVVLLLKRRAK